MVGLGKTVQLALSALLMALEGDKPILIIVPKALIWQWQDEMTNLLDMPSAVWNGRCWVDENQFEYPAKEEFALDKCPRRVGVVSQGLIVRSKERVSAYLLNQSYECIIVDEAHRARRKNLGQGKENEAPQPNNLMSFLLEIAEKTKSMLLATATPVQIHPIEAWDLLYILSKGNDFILGDYFSNWQREANRGINLITGKEEISEDNQKWDWLRNPFPPAEERPDTFGVFRRLMGLLPGKFNIPGSEFYSLSPQKKAILKRIFADDFIRNHNPYIRYIIRRERKYLETTVNPETNQPYLKPINVVLFGEEENEGLNLSTHLYDAYNLAEEFSILLGNRVKSSGFIKTMLLRRVCSSMFAGLSTATGMLNNWVNEGDDEEDDFESVDENNISLLQDSPFKNLSKEEISCLRRFVRLLEEHQEKDPKYDLLKRILIEDYKIEPWINRGCIVFSQYFDTIKWICERFAKDFPEIIFGLYAGSDKSGVYENGLFVRKTKEDIKKMVRLRQIKLLFGTDAASEGLNLQALGTLINLDLPWNPTRLEQRKGRIQRIGQERDEVLIYNMRYKDSVEDRVHQLLASRLKNIRDLFGQIPDTLEDVWVEVALNRIEEAEKRIFDFSENDTHPFYNKYQNQANISPIKWEDCAIVLDRYEKRKYLMEGW
jgi:SNF2 family DNA or RNA helicase